MSSLFDLALDIDKKGIIPYECEGLDSFLKRSVKIISYSEKLLEKITNQGCISLKYHRENKRFKIKKHNKVAQVDKNIARKFLQSFYGIDTNWVNCFYSKEFFLHPTYEDYRAICHHIAHSYGYIPLIIIKSKRKKDINLTLKHELSHSCRKSFYEYKGLDHFYEEYLSKVVEWIDSKKIIEKFPKSFYKSHKEYYSDKRRLKTYIKQIKLFEITRTRLEDNFDEKGHYILYRLTAREAKNISLYKKDIKNYLESKYFKGLRWDIIKEQAL